MSDAKRYVTEAERGIKTIAARIHLHDYAILRKTLHNDELSLQEWIVACVESYLKGDTNMRKIVSDHKLLGAVPQEVKDKFMLSPRERNDIFNEIEKSDQEDS